jgi:hypothetical protein
MIYNVICRGILYVLYDLQRHMSWYFICSMIYNVICRGILYVLYDLQRHMSWYFICSMIYNVLCVVNHRTYKIP